MVAVLAVAVGAEVVDELHARDRGDRGPQILDLDVRRVVAVPHRVAGAPSQQVISRLQPIGGDCQTGFETGFGTG